MSNATIKRPDLKAIEARARECPCCKSGRPHSNHYSAPSEDTVDLLDWINHLETTIKAKNEKFDRLVDELDHDTTVKVLIAMKHVGMIK